MRRIVVIGDQHGYNTWEKALEYYGEPKVGELEYVMLGDYFDSFRNNQQTCLDNYLKIMEYRKSHDGFVVLIGNHDLHYFINNGKDICSGFSHEHAFTNQRALCENQSLMKIGHRITTSDAELIFTHAGITQFWADEVVPKFGGVLDEIFEYNTWLKEYDDYENIDTNTPYKIESLNWNSLKGYNAYGDTVSNGCVWVRPNSLSSNPKKFGVAKNIQFVGHTPIKVSSVSMNWYRCTTDPDVDFVMCDTATFVTTIVLDDNNNVADIEKVDVGNK